MYNRKEYMRLYWIKHKIELRKSHKEWIKNNLEDFNERRRRKYSEDSVYRKNVREMAAGYRKRHHEEIIQKKREYYKNNREDKIFKHKIYSRKRRKIDPIFKMINNSRHRINQAIKGKVKSQRTRALLGCSVEVLKQHIEAQFKPNMSWENYGPGWYGKGATEWHIDHIKPCCSFDLSNPEEQSRCFNYTNLQPLWAKDNMIKSGN